MKQKNNIKNFMTDPKLFNGNELNNNLSLSRNSKVKEQNLFSNKSNKEILLYLIKTSQISILTQKNDDSKAHNLLKIKNCLSELKTNLTYILNEKNINENYLENNINKVKNELQFTIQKNKKKDNSNNDNNDYYLETEIREKNYEGNELSKLKYQNFIIENEIRKTEFLILNFQNNLNLSKIAYSIEEEQREIFLFNIIENNKEKEIYSIMNYLLIEEKELLEKYRNLNKQQQDYIEKYKKDINKIKNDIISRNIIFANNLILEKSLDNKIEKNPNWDNYNAETKGATNNVNISSVIDNSKDLKNIVNLNMSFNFNINIGNIKNI